MITVVISTSSNPSSSGSQDHTINLQSGDTLPVDVPLYAYGQDSADATAILTYSWYLVRSPAGSNAILSANNIQNPTLESVDIWGDYRVFCIAANSITGETSETDPIKAPNEAFTQVRVRSTHLALVKPAPGERDWFSYAYEWVDAIESFDPLIDDHETRITTLEGSAPTPAGDPLTISAPTAGSIDLSTQSLSIQGTTGEIEVTGVSSSAGYAFTVGLTDTITVDKVITDAVEAASATADLIGAWRLDRTGNAASEILTRADTPGTGSAQRAGVILASDFFTGANNSGIIPNMIMIPFSQQGSKTHYASSTSQTTYDTDDEVTDNTTASAVISNPCVVMYHNHTFKPLYLYSISSLVLNAGQPQAQPYIFELVIYETLTKLLNNTAVNTGITVTHNQNIDNGVSGAELVSTEVGGAIYTVPAGGYFGLKCNQSNKLPGFKYVSNILGAIEL